MNSSRCVECGELLDLDIDHCRSCGATEDLGEEPFVVDESVLDKLQPWSAIKHDIVASYAAVYTQILSKQPFIKRFVYLDAFAGAGVARTKDDELAYAGAARVLQAEPPFSEYHFMELHPEKADILRELARNRPNARVHVGDYRSILPGLLSRCRYKDFARGLCLLDPYGLSVDYELLKQIAATGTVEIFFNFMIVSANRNVLWRDRTRCRSAAQP
jgi:three-Cys-motif partner protein